MAAWVVPTATTPSPHAGFASAWVAPRRNVGTMSSFRDQRQCSVMTPKSSPAAQLSGDHGERLRARSPTRQLRASCEQDYYYSSTSETLVHSSVARAVVWFRIGDLRLRDHPGLFSAGENTREAIVPLFIVTPRTPLNEVLQILSALRSGLRARRADLIIRFAESEQHGLVEFILSEFPCDAVYVRSDSHSPDLEIFDWIDNQLRSSTSTNDLHSVDCQLVRWRDELRDFVQDITSWIPSIPSSYPEFKKWDVRSKASLLASTVDFEPAVLVPGLPKDPALEPGNLAEIRELHDGAAALGSFEAILGRYEADTIRLLVEDYDTVAALCSKDEDVGERMVTRLLERLENYEAVDIARSLEPVMRFGLVSPRRIWEIVCAFERLNGRLFMPIYRSGAKAILTWLDAREFTSCLAERDISDESITVDGNHRPKFWRWRGTLVRYVEEGHEFPEAKEKPAILFVHGFGASAQHWGRNVFELSARFHVFAVCMPGFGRAEKPPYVYTQDLWEVFIAEFVRDVVGRDVFVVGNSIGGYMSCAFASDGYPSMVAGLTLVNTAGPLFSPSEYELQLQSIATAVPVQPVGIRSALSWVLRNSELARWAFGNLLLIFLRRNIKKTLSRAYPIADPSEHTELLDEIYRNSLDPGAVGVLSSGFILPTSRPLNELLGRYSGPMLVVQGQLDVLGNPVRRAELLKTLYPAAKIVILEAGHCPHDESPEIFNQELESWIDSVQAGRHGSRPEAVVDDVAAEAECSSAS